ncbi:hypothetical protein [Clostridium pasteurianum]|uniref:Uncharacterized protein n=1 Tax=Clostridium pasteurianum BC1 TaxID=86416 RepID=R4KFG3_CLOPA|nr:hypothetical protein [Clostridium pasteurianum]AGK98350.1 hypothetical protein Clopa_3566 [Clostridium pasteurianum BC1]
MNLSRIQLSILFLQLSTLTLNLNAIFVKKTTDSTSHIISACIEVAILILSFKTWHDCNIKKKNSNHN